MVINWHSVAFFVPYIALVIALIALILAIIMHTRIKKMFRSANVPDIERLLGLHTKTLEEFVRFKAESTEYLKNLDRRMKKKMTDASTLRFNSFQGEGVGGNQSFSSVFADEEGNGVVITSLYTRERTNVFAKPIKNWLSEYKLSDEEIKIISRAKENNGK